MSIRETPTPTLNSEIRGSEACRDLTLRNASTTPPRLEMCSGGDRKMSYNVAFCLGVQEIWVEWDYRAFLCSSSKMKKQEVTQEVNNVQNGADTKGWNLHPPSFLLAWLRAS